MKKGSEFASPLQIAHVCILKGVLGVKRTTPYWAVARVWTGALAVLFALCCCQVL